MRRIKLIAVIIGLVTALSALSGCAAEESAPELVDAGKLAGGSFSDISAVIVEGNSSENNSGENPSNSTQGNVQITVPKSAEYCEGIAKLAPYDEEFVYELKNMFLGGEEITPEIKIKIFEGDTYPERRDYFFEADGKKLTVFNTSYSIGLNGDLDTLQQFLFMPPNSKYDGNAEDFSELSAELDFCSREDAVKQVRGIFEKIGVRTDKEADVYAFSQTELQLKIDAEFAERGKIPKYNFTGDGINDTEMLTSYTVDKSQEFYYIELNAEYNNVPVYNYEFKMSSVKELYISHPRICAIYSAKGLDSFHIDCYRFDFEETKSVSKLISPEDAAAVINEKYSDMGNIVEAYIDELELMYVCTPDYSTGKYNVHRMKMLPAWVCTCYRTSIETKRGGDEKITFKEIFLIDAQTGLEII